MKCSILIVGFAFFLFSREGNATDFQTQLTGLLCADYQIPALQNSKAERLRMPAQSISNTIIDSEWRNYLQHKHPSLSDEMLLISVPPLKAVDVVTTNLGEVYIFENLESDGFADCLQTYAIEPFYYYPPIAAFLGEKLALNFGIAEYKSYVALPSAKYVASVSKMIRSKDRKLPYYYEVEDKGTDIKTYLKHAVNRGFPLASLRTGGSVWLHDLSYHLTLIGFPEQITQKLFQFSKASNEALLILSHMNYSRQRLQLAYVDLGRRIDSATGNLTTRYSGIFILPHFLNSKLSQAQLNVEFFNFKDCFASFLKDLLKPESKKEKDLIVTVSRQVLASYRTGLSISKKERIGLLEGGKLFKRHLEELRDWSDKPSEELVKARVQIWLRLKLQDS